ncbi:exopolysaccharide transport family protein [Crocinitomix algicola]|uniref:exopolysaccharide transport family protein n=1 Tax=Crocinitomix algicola TaxID=1740263 RepID=UPI00082FF104|nr:exopolysaccharide transport family protein [Crocinitomix algicola]
MLEIHKIKNILITLIKGSPIIIGCLAIGLFIANRVIRYSTPKFQSMAKIKLDDFKYGMSGNNLYEDFDVFTSENKIETEAEILKSHLLVGQTLDKLNIQYKIWRKGRLKTTLLYEDFPFSVELSPEFNLHNEPFEILISGDKISLKYPDSETTLTSGKFNLPIQLDEENYIILRKNLKLLKKRKLDLNGVYLFEVPSRSKAIAEAQKDLDVKAIDKEIAVIRVVYKHENPKLAADFTNALCDAYINDYISSKSKAAEKTLTFIEERMQSISNNLSKAENNLEDFKIQNSVVNTLQETETGLREISKLRLQLINLETEQEATKDLEAYIATGDYYEGTAINFGFGDLVLTELVKKLKLYTDQKKDLLIKYTEQDEQVINVNAKIDDIENYIKEAVRRNLINLETKQKEISTALAELEQQFVNIPTREKEMRVLEREFMNNEMIYNFLFQKRLEAQIASQALMSFHRIIQPATISKKPVSPNKTLIIFVTGFLSILIGILFVFTRKSVSGKIMTKADVEKLSSIPVIGTVKRKSQTEFPQIAANLVAKTKENQRTVLITSAVKKEGKTYLTTALADSFKKMGYTVAVLDFNVHHSNKRSDFFIEELLQENNLEGKDSITIGFKPNTENASFVLAHKNFKSVIEAIQNKFDIVLIDTPGSIITPDAEVLMQYANLGLYIVRSNVSKAQYTKSVDLLQEENPNCELYILLNGVDRSTNFSGTFNGSRLNYNKRPKGIFKLFKYYYKTYISTK